MRVLTVSELKCNNGQGGGKADYPQKGTFVREVCDALRANSGHAIDLSKLAHSRSSGALPSAIDALRDMYGLDIRKVTPRGFMYVLAGEWFGAHYTDYCAAAFKEGERK